MQLRTKKFGSRNVTSSQRQHPTSLAHIKPTSQGKLGQYLLPLILQN